MSLERDPRTGQPRLPDPLPDAPGELLAVAQRFLEHARLAVGSGAPDFDHGMAAVRFILAKLELSSHRDLGVVTKDLKRATWFLFC